MRYKKSAISSQQIVEAAIRVLARQGYARTSLMDIAREAGMSKGAVHYHFPTKEELMAVVLRTACDAVQRKSIDAWVIGQNPFEALHNTLVELWAARASKSDEALVVADLLAQSLYVETLRPPLADYYELAAKQIQDHLVENLIPLGIQPRIPLHVLPRVVIGILDGLVMQAFVDPEALDPADVVQAIETLAMSVFGLEALKP